MRNGTLNFVSSCCCQDLYVSQCFAENGLEVFKIPRAYNNFFCGVGWGGGGEVSFVHGVAIIAQEHIWCFFF